MEHLTDEILSSHLDGERLASGAATHLAGCPACTARLAQVRAVSNAVGAPPPPADPTRRDHHLAVAVAAVDEQDGALSHPTSIRRLQPRRPSVPTWLGAAAAVLIVAGVAVALANTGGKTAATQTASKPAAGAATPAPGGTTPRPGPASFAAGSGAADATTGAPAGGANGPEAAPVLATSGIDGGSLGQQADMASLVTTVEARLETATSSAPRSTGGQAPAPTIAPSPPCVAQARADAVQHNVAPADLVFHAVLQWQGQPAVVLAFAASAQPHAQGGPLRLEIMQVGGCQPLASRTT
jgi:hypothetical protein